MHIVKITPGWHCAICYERSHRTFLSSSNYEILHLDFGIHVTFNKSWNTPPHIKIVTNFEINWGGIFCMWDGVSMIDIFFFIGSPVVGAVRDGSVIMGWPHYRALTHKDSMLYLGMVILAEIILAASIPKQFIKVMLRIFDVKFSRGASFFDLEMKMTTKWPLQLFSMYTCFHDAYMVPHDHFGGQNRLERGLVTIYSIALHYELKDPNSYIKMDQKDLKANWKVR